MQQISNYKLPIFDISNLKNSKYIPIIGKR